MNGMIDFNSLTLSFYNVHLFIGAHKEWLGHQDWNTTVRP